MRHGVAGVHDEVHDDLFDLSGIGLHAAQPFIERRGEYDVFTDQTVQHLFRVGHKCVEIQDGGLQHLLPAEGQELARQ